MQDPLFYLWCFGWDPTIRELTLNSWRLYRTKALLCVPLALLALNLLLMCESTLVADASYILARKLG